MIVGSARVIAGIDYIDDKVDSNTPFDVSSRNNVGYFASYNTRIGATDLEASLRSDDNEQFGTKTTGGVAAGQDIGSGKRLTASYGTAFKAPTFNELYFPGFGNPNLGAETSDSIDLGLSSSTGSTTWALNVFNTRIDDLIGFDPVTFAPVNINEAEITGLEISAATSLAGWNLSGSLTLQNPEDSSGSVNDGNLLPRRAEEVLFIDVSRQFNSWNIGGSVQYQGDSYDDLGNFTKLDAFTVVDIRAEYLLNPAWAVSVHINNLFDEEYETAAFFNQDGTNGTVSLRYIPR
jgi:vitamin B12 transporter